MIRLMKMITMTGFPEFQASAIGMAADFNYTG
jgi:hypothetical protein